MKIERQRRVIDRLFVLGAGASHALSGVDVRKRKYVRHVTPLDKDFLKRLEHFRHTRGWQRKSFDLIKEEWLDQSDFIENGLEQSIIKRVSQYEFLSSLHSRKTRRRTLNADYINTLSHLITDFLIGCRSNTSGNTKLFTNWVFPPGTEPREYTNRIITFNYDTLIERQLIDRGVSKKKIYFDRHASRKESGLRRNSDEKFTHPLVLKLHGSVNWRCDRADYEKMISGNSEPDVRVVIWGEDQVCPDPSDSVSPLIIPPIPNKPITAVSIFRYLWTTAYEYLHEAKEVIIVGYSCPTTDTLARTMFTHFEARKLSRIVIVDPDALALSRYRDLMPKRIAGSARWEYFSDFNEYIRHEVFQEK